MDFSELLKTSRLAKGFSQDKLAELVKEKTGESITGGYISNLERNAYKSKKSIKSRPSEPLVDGLAEVLGVNKAVFRRAAGYFVDEKYVELFKGLYLSGEATDYLFEEDYKEIAKFIVYRIEMNRRLPPTSENPLEVSDTPMLLLVPEGKHFDDDRDLTPGEKPLGLEDLRALKRARDSKDHLIKKAPK